MCIEQDFDNANDRGVLVRSNRTFQSRFALCISLYFKECSEGIGSSLEVYERKNLVGVFALYALSQRFTGKKFYKVMWEIILNILHLTTAVWMVRVESMLTVEEVMMLERFGVAITAGSDFGDYRADRFVRISYANDKTALEQALAQCAEALS